MRGFALASLALALFAGGAARAGEEAPPPAPPPTDACGHEPAPTAAAGDDVLARSALASSLAAAEKDGDREGAAQALAGLARLERRLGHMAEALAYQRRAVAIRETLPDCPRLAEALRAVGMIEESLCQYANALASQQRALCLAEAAKDRAAVAAALSNLGSVYWAEGEYAKALSFHERALAEVEALGDPLRTASSLANLALVYQRLGDGEKALAYEEKALHRLEELGDRPRIAVALQNLGGIHWSLGDADRALTYVEKARRLSEEIGDRAGVAEALGNLGHIHVSLGDLHGSPTHYREAVAYYEKSLARREEIGDRAGVAATLGFLGAVSSTLGDPDAALGYQRRAIMEAEEIGAIETVVHNLWGMAGTRLSAGEPDEAVLAARRAVDALPTLVHGLSQEEGAASRGRLAPIFEIGARAAASLDDPADFAFFLESGRAGTLLEALGGRDALQALVVPFDLRGSESRARAEEARTLAVYRRALDGGNLAECRARRAEYDAARDGVKASIERIQRESKAAANLVYPRAAPLDEIRARLRPGEAFVAYMLLSGRAMALVATKGGARLVTLAPSDEITQACEALGVDATGPDPGERIDALRALLVEPLALGDGVRRLLISPDGAISYVPFALLAPDREIAYEPSGTTYLLLSSDRERTGVGVLALGDPDYETDGGGKNALARMNSGVSFVPLPGTREEAKAIGDVVLLGSEASEKAFRYTVGRRPRWRSVHFACHGLVDVVRPTLSCLALTPSGEDDGFLTALEVFGSRIPADLVVLSACKTGRGKVVRGEGIVGLVQAFTFAGAPRVIASLWNGDDRATLLLMTTFYEKWRAGESTAASLAAAQKAVRAKPEWAHPFFWAGWVLWGVPD